MSVLLSDREESGGKNRCQFYYLTGKNRCQFYYLTGEESVSVPLSDRKHELTLFVHYLFMPRSCETDI